MSRPETTSRAKGGLATMPDFQVTRLSHRMKTIMGVRSVIGTLLKRA